MPKVTVIIPTYNRAAFVADAIHSVQDQSFTDWQIIVADDGSTDNTREVVGSFGQPVRYLSLPHSGLPAVARNAALKEADGEYIAFLDSDDLMLPRKLVTQVRALDDHPDVAFVYSDGYFFRDDCAKPTGTILDGVDIRSGRLFPHLLQGNFLFVATLLLRRGCIDAVGWFDEDPVRAAVEDYDLWLRLAARYPVMYVPGHMAAVRRHEGSLSRDVVAVRRRVMLVLQKLASLYPHLMKEHRDAFRQAYARCHAALAVDCFRCRNFLLLFGHAVTAMGYLVLFPRAGTKAFLTWRRHHRKRLPARS